MRRHHAAQCRRIAVHSLREVAAHHQTTGHVTFCQTSGGGHGFCTFSVTDPLLHPVYLAVALAQSRWRADL